MPANIFFSCLPRVSSDWGTNHPNNAANRKLPFHQSNLPASFQSTTINTESHPKQITLATGDSFAIELLRAQEQERQHLANELHHNLGQSLILLKNQVLKMKNNQPEKSETTLQLNTLAEMITASLQKVRNLSYELQPYELNLLGLKQALQGLVEVTASSVSWPLTVDLPQLNQLFPEGNEIYIYRIMQESLQIIQNQTEITGVRLLAYTRPTAVIWEIHVSGPATFFDYLAAHFLINISLRRMQEYLKIIDGSITFWASTPRTTIMQINVPLTFK